MPLQRDVIRSLLKQNGRDFVRNFMITYYRTDGKDEHRLSPHAQKDVEVLVDTILQDVESQVI